MKNNLYRLFQRPRAFWKYLTSKLIAIDVLQSTLYICLYIADKFICIVFVDNLIFWGKDESDIHDLLNETS